VALQVRLAHHLVDAGALGPLGGDPLDAGAAAVHQHEVGKFGAGPVEAADDGARVGDGLAAGDGDQGAVRQMRPGLAVFPRPDEVAGVDGGRGQRVGPARVAAMPRAPGLAGDGAVLLGGGVAQLFDGVAVVAEVLRPVGQQLQLAGLHLAAVLRGLQVAHDHHAGRQGRAA